jgi:hypothetical protein
MSPRVRLCNMRVSLCMCLAYQGGGDAHEAEEGGRGRALRLHHDGEHLRRGFHECVYGLE